MSYSTIAYLFYGAPIPREKFEEIECSDELKAAKLKTVSVGSYCTKTQDYLAVCVREKEERTLGWTKEMNALPTVTEQQDQSLRKMLRELGVAADPKWHLGMLEH